MECHRCRHRVDVESGKYRGTPFERTPCAECELGESSMGTIAYDDGRAAPAVSGALDRAQLAGSGQAVEGDQDDQVPISLMSAAVAQLLAMPSVVRDVVCWRFMGVRYGEIAQRMGVTVGAVENRHRRAMQKWPALRALFAEKAAKQQRRRRTVGVSRGGCRQSEAFTIKADARNNRGG